MRRRLAALGRRRRRDEHGVVAVFVAIITCFTLIPLAALAVDIGVQRVARRDAQAVADLVALDLSRQLDGRAYSAIQPTLQALADKSSLRNSTGGSPLKVVPELGTLSANFDPANPSAYFVPTSTATVIPTAVRVTASATVGFSFISGTGGVSRQAVATARARVCFRLGSYAATVNSGNSALLNSLINDSLNLSAISYEGLANANVTLLGLATELGFGTTDELLNSTITLNQFYLASAKALQKQGGDAADVTLLNNLAAANFGSLPSIKMGDLIGVGPADDAALQSTVNLFDLVTGSAFLANGNNALAVPSLTAGVPGVTTVSASLKVIEGPQGGCDVGTATTNQVSFDVTFTLVPSNTGLGGLLGLKSGLTTVVVHAALAPATAVLDKSYCTTPKGVDVKVTSALTALSTRVTTNLTLFGLPIATLDSTASTNSPATTTTVSIRIPPDSLHQAKSAGSGTVVPQVSVASSDLTLLGAISLGPLVSAVTSGLITPLVNPLVNNVNTLLITPLTNILGMRLGGADVFLDELPACNAIRSLTG